MSGFFGPFLWDLKKNGHLLDRKSIKKFKIKIQTIWYQNVLIFREKCKKLYCSHRNFNQTWKQNSRSFTYKKAAFLLIDSFLAYIEKYIITLLGIEKLFQKNWPEFSDYKIFMYILLVLQHFLVYCFTFVGLIKKTDIYLIGKNLCFLWDLKINRTFIWSDIYLTGPVIRTILKRPSGFWEL